MGEGRRGFSGPEEAGSLDAALISAIPLGIAVVSREGVVELANPAFRRAFAAGGGGVRGRRLREVMGEGLFDGLELGPSMARVAREGRPLELEDLRVLSPKDGREHHYDLIITPFPSSVRPVSKLVVIIRDSTEARLLEHGLQQSARMETVGRLARGMAHDYNNILTGILGLVDLALEEPEVREGSRLHQDLLEIKRLGERAKGLTAQLLAFGSREGVSRRPVDLNGLIQERRALLASVVGEGVELVLDLEPGLPPVMGDPAQLEQVLLNLVLNGCEAMDGRGRLTIATSQALLSPEFFRARGVQGRPGPYVRLAVTDTGCGIRREHIPRVFEPFFSTKDEGGARGRGLGLASVYGIVKQHHGYIWVESRRGQGSTFEVYLPPAPAMAASERWAGGSSNPGEALPGPILVVEDEPQVLDVTCRMLQRAGFPCIAASSPAEALALVEQGREVALLLSDMVLPEMDGITLYERMKRSVPGLKALFMSGYPGEVLGRKGISRKGIPLLEKPFSSGQLLAAINRALQGGGR